MFTKREPNDTDCERESDEQRAAGVDLRVALAENVVGVALVPLSPSLHIWIRGHISLVLHFRFRVLRARCEFRAG